MRYDTLIIGSGVTGLSAALYLARKGQKVLVLEAAPAPGPVLRGFTREGAHFDTGLHLTGGLEPGGILRSYLRLLGLEGELEVQPFSQHAAEVAVFEGRNRPPAELPQGREAFQAALSARFPLEAAGIARYLDAVEAVMASSPFLNPGQDARQNLGHFPSDVTLDQELDLCTADPELRLLLSLRCALHGVEPSLARFVQHALVDGSMRASLHTLRGGGKALVRALTRNLTRHGGTVRASCPVTRVLAQDGAVTGVECADGTRFSAPACLYTGHPALLPGLLEPGALRGVYLRRLEALPETPSTMLYFAILEGECPFEGSAFYLCPNLDTTKLLSGKVPEESVLFFTLSPAGPGRHALSAVMPCGLERFLPWQGSVRGHRPKAYLEQKASLLRLMEQRIISAFPEITVRPRMVAGATPLTLGDYARNPRCGIYGVRHEANTVELLPLTRMKGLVLAGQSVLLPGLVGSMISAFVACDILHGGNSLHEELRQCHQAGS